jgi:hypothetical protein
MSTPPSQEAGQGALDLGLLDRVAQEDLETRDYHNHAVPAEILS